MPKNGVVAACEAGVRKADNWRPGGSHNTLPGTKEIRKEDIYNLNSLSAKGKEGGQNIRRSGIIGRCRSLS
jgi:hypothetical protein